jgi:hypothetical protein
LYARGNAIARNARGDTKNRTAAGNVERNRH